MRLRNWLLETDGGNLLLDLLERRTGLAVIDADDVDLLTEGALARVGLNGSARAQMLERAERYVAARMELAGARPGEFAAGVVEDYQAVYARPDRVEGGTWFMWLASEGYVSASAVVGTHLMGDTFLENRGRVFDHPMERVFVLGTVTRMSDGPLLSMGSVNGPTAS